MKNQFELIRQTRKNFIKLIMSVDNEQLNFIPGVFKNNLAWNLGHVLVTQQRLCYSFTGYKMPFVTELFDKYKKGSNPENFVSLEEIELLKEELLDSIDQLEADYNAGLFKNYMPFVSEFGYSINSIEEAISFDVTHEALHLGISLGIKKLVMMENLVAASGNY